MCPKISFCPILADFAILPVIERILTGENEFEFEKVTKKRWNFHHEKVKWLKVQVNENYKKLHRQILDRWAIQQKCFDTWNGIFYDPEYRTLWISQMIYILRKKKYQPERQPTSYSNRNLRLYFHDRRALTRVHDLRFDNIERSCFFVL